MTINELSMLWADWMENYGITEKSINDFCNYYATSYEEYMAFYELLTDTLDFL